MSVELDEHDFPITFATAKTAKDILLFHSYGEFNGFKCPSIPELYLLRGLIDGAIYELQNKN